VITKTVADLVESSITGPKGVGTGLHAIASAFSKIADAIKPAPKAVQCPRCQTIVIDPSQPPEVAE
jgi:hypothetical protein